MAAAGTTTAINVPGPRGLAGTDGTDGTNGNNSHTTITTAFTMPAEGADVTAAVGNSEWMTPNQMIYVQNAGYMRCQSKPTTTSVVIRNMESTGSSLYPGNIAPGTSIPVASKVSPAGLQGPAGVAAGAPNDATYLTATADGDLTAEQAMDGGGDGVVTFDDSTDTFATQTVGTADNNIAEIDDAGGLVSGDTVFGTATGLETKTASAARTALGLGTAAVAATGVSSGNVPANASNLTNGDVVFATGAGVETKTAAAAAAIFGVSGVTISTTSSNPYTMLTTDEMKLINIVGGSTVNLPTAVGNSGLRFIIKKIGTGPAVAVTANGVETIDGVNSQSLAAQWNSMVVVSNGTAWFIESDA